VASKRVLAQSYRVPQAVHEVAVDWISQVEDRVAADYRPTAELGAVYREGHQYRDPDSLIESAVRRLNSPRGHHDQEVVMILASCNYMLAPITKRLKELGIPFHNPYRARHGGWNPLVGARRLLAFLRPDEKVWGSEARFWQWNDIKAWAEVLQADKCFVRGFKSHINMRTDKNRFGDLGEDKVELDELLRWLKPASQDPAFDMDIDWWEENLRANDFKSQQFALTVARRHGAAVLREQPRLVVGTIHSVKGGEADHVYLLPDLSPVAHNESWQRPGSPRNSVVRQFYVGITRARHSLTLCEASDPYAVDWR
jgi:superfamily I DNA/RNA helicase